jgi:pimeloyl-ACP methyl ester carboxylesterase
LEHREDGFWPRFDIDIVLGALSSLGTRGWWDEWKKIQCPTLIVRGDRGSLSAAMAEQMAGFLRQGELLTVANAGHDVHIDQSKRVAEVLTARVR